jgi:purine-nucleoside phosphorylase
MYEELKEAADYIRSKYSKKPIVGLVLGTGLGELANELELEQEVPYYEIPYFPHSTVESHAGKLLFGQLAGKTVVIMQGRVHYYEGFTMQQVVFPIRVMKLLGIEAIFISNAAGGLSPDQEMADLMMLTDHLDLMKGNPLIGKNIDNLGERFPDMSEAYHPKLIELGRKVAAENQIRLLEGVYAAVSGPNLETKAEYKMLRILGGDAVGMSTVPEVIACVHMGLPAFAVSVITDLGVEGKIQKTSIHDVLKAAADAAPKLQLLFHEMVRNFDSSILK